MNYILLFFIYGFMGWIIEVIYTFITDKRLVNRGFLIGPICPIYGAGCVLLILLLDSYKNDFFVLFLGSVFICSILEYLTSYFMEKIFNARWWDYSYMKYNINGRICLETMLPFGILGSVIINFINPKLVNIIDKIDLNIINVFVILLLLIFILDIVISCSVVSKLKKTLKITGDNTEEIKEKIKSIFINRSFLYRRLFRGFPQLFLNKININKLEQLRKDIVKQIKEKTKNKS